MLTINCIGGIGNQMFQIALGESFKIRNKSVCLDTGLLDSYSRERDWEQAYKLFNINIPIVKCGRVKKKIYKILNQYYVEHESGNFESKLFALDNGYLDGCWQSYKYFKNYRIEICNIFKFPAIDKKNQCYLEQIKNVQTSISLHVRMGDYLQGINKDIYGGICTEEYYSRAICYFKENYHGCHFFVFSNDKDYIQKYKDDEYFTIVDCNDEKNAWQDMYLMTQCTHNIVANSSFSWWGAWLNQHDNKEIIAPKKWINTKEMKDICPENWIRL